LSQATPEPGTPSVAELAERIKSLKAAHTVDEAPARTATRRTAVAEEPVTARIRRRIETAPAVEPVTEPAAMPADLPPPETAIPARREQPTPAAIHPFPTAEAAPVHPQPVYRQNVARSRREDARQLSLF
jgi:hypothetical protein